MTRFFDNVLELIFPSKTKCIVCGSDLAKQNPLCVCSNCEKTMPYI